MNKLILDAGNSRLKAGVFFNQQLLSSVVFNYQDDVRAISGTFEQWVNSYFIDTVGVCSVRNQEPILDFLLYYFQGKDIIWISPNMPLPFSSLYASIETLGADRIALAAAGQEIFSEQNVLIAGLGTCITLDFVDSAGNYHGGSISPGLMMRLRALHDYTAKLPFLNIPAEFPNFIGNTTEKCMLSGILFGIIHEINGFYERYQDLYPNLKFCLTGGDTIHFEKQLKGVTFVSQNLVLTGSNKIIDYQLNAK
ncbi:MAG: type III pantothenate kinase [Bacteroidia bacterium]|nr:type III pantothenate kinase [Bacteroidia bacterium]